MHNALKGFLGVAGAITAGLMGLMALDDGMEVSPKSEALAANMSAGSPEVVDADSQDPTSRIGATMLEQAIFDAFQMAPSATESERRRASNASDYLGAKIIAAGYLCAKPVEMQQAAPGQYGIGCIANRDGTGRALYLIDSRTGNVDLIS